MPIPFKNGDALTEAELSQVFFRITGLRRIPGASAQVLAAKLSKHRPARFEFEVNRLRGFGFELEEIGGSAKLVT